MKLKLKEDPKEWRKAAWFSALGLSLLAGLLCWRRVLPLMALPVVLLVLAFAAILAWYRPRWFRGWYRFGGTVGFYLGQCLGFIVLNLVFFLVLTPFGVMTRLAGKDPLSLKRRPGSSTYWLPARKPTPLDRLF